MSAERVFVPKRVDANSFRACFRVCTDFVCLTLTNCTRLSTSSNDRLKKITSIVFEM